MRVETEEKMVFFVYIGFGPSSGCDETQSLVKGYNDERFMKSEVEKG